MINPKSIPLSKIIDALLDESTPFSPRYLNRLSDLEPADSTTLSEIWPKISARRREALLEDLEELHLADDLLCFEAVGRIGLKDDLVGVRRRAVSLLQEYELVDLLPTFVHMAEHDPDRDVRAAAVAALAPYIYLGEVEDLSPKKLKIVEECLFRLASDTENSLVKRRAIEALGFSSRPEVVGLIEQAYTSPDVDWLITALLAMGRSANSHWKPQVLKMLDHKRPAVRAEAASAAGELEIKAAVPKLVDLLEDVDPGVRMAAIWAVSQIGGEGVRAALEKMRAATDDDDEADQIDDALENLDFTEEMKDLTLFVIPEDGDEPQEPSENDVDDIKDDLISEDDED